MDLGSPGDWHYLAEGGANVVLSYRGPLVHLRGHALRLRKRQVRQGQLPSAPSPVPEIDPSVLLYDTVVSKLLPERAAALSQVPLRPGFLEEGTPEWHAARPNSRAAANDEIDCSKQTAVLAQNMVQSFSLDQEVQTVSFEIKVMPHLPAKLFALTRGHGQPKWGFMPSPEFLSETTQQAKTNTCRYCRHSCFRRKMTSYCPMDLYSGDPSRVRNAISALFRDWVQSSGNTNNLRIFLNGHLLVASLSFTGIFCAVCRHRP